MRILLIFSLALGGLGSVANAADRIGTPEADTITGTPDADRIEGLAGYDELFGMDGDDTILGGDGNDEMFGGHGNDTLDGGPGNDFLDGREDDDTLTGGPGRDIFVFHPEGGLDAVTDFEAAEDGIGLSEIDPASVVVRVDGADTLLEMPDGGRVRLQGIVDLDPSEVIMDLQEAFRRGYG